MLLECRFAEESHVVAELTIIGVLEGFILCLREENTTGGDPVKPLNTIDCHEEPNRPFNPGGVVSTYIHTEGGGEGLMYSCCGADDVSGLKERRTSRLDEAGFA